MYALNFSILGHGMIEVDTGNSIQFVHLKPCPWIKSLTISCHKGKPTSNTVMQTSGSAQIYHKLVEFLQTTEHLMLAPIQRHIPTIKMLRNSIFFPCTLMCHSFLQGNLHGRRKQEQREDHTKVSR